MIAPSIGHSHNAVVKIRQMQTPWSREEKVPKLEITPIFHVFFGTDKILKIESSIMNPYYEIRNYLRKGTPDYRAGGTCDRL
jgi:hypothetical protein